MVRALQFLLALALLSSCSTLPTAPIDWPKVAQCGPGANDVLATVSRILLQDGADLKKLSQHSSDELENLARTNGAATVACVVDQLIQDWAAPGAAAQPIRLAALQRGQAFADAIGTKVQR